MKTSQRHRSHLSSLLLGSSFLLFAYLAAASLTWDANTGTTGAQDGSGNWAGNNWWNGSANVTWTAANDAVFGAGTDGTYFLDIAGLPNPAVQTIRFINSGYTLTNDVSQSVALSAASGATIPQIRLDSGKTATVGTNVILEPSTAVILYVGATTPAAGGTLNIENGGIVRSAQQSLIIDGGWTSVSPSPY